MCLAESRHPEAESDWPSSHPCLGEERFLVVDLSKFIAPKWHNWHAAGPSTDHATSVGFLTGPSSLPRKDLSSLEATSTDFGHSPYCHSFAKRQRRAADFLATPAAYGPSPVAALS